MKELTVDRKGTAEIIDVFLNARKKSIELLGGSSAQRDWQEKRECLFQKLLNSFSWEEIDLFMKEHGLLLSEEECARLSETRDLLFKESTVYKAQVAEEKRKREERLSICRTTNSFSVIKDVIVNAPYDETEGLSCVAEKRRKELLAMVYGNRNYVSAEEIHEALMETSGLTLGFPLSRQATSLGELFLEKALAEVAGRENDHLHIGRWHTMAIAVWNARKWKPSSSMENMFNVLKDMFCKACAQALSDCGEDVGRMKELRGTLDSRNESLLEQMREEARFKGELERRLLRLLSELDGWDEEPLIKLIVPEHDDRYARSKMSEITWKRLACNHFFFDLEKQRLWDILYQYLIDTMGENFVLCVEENSRRGIYHGPSYSHSQDCCLSC